jgi:putative phosphoribosyl transferase
LRNRTFVFRDRDEAGTRLAERLLEYKSWNPTVLAIPSGGVPIGFAVSQSLKAAFDLIVSRKMPLPYTREAGFGALTWDDIVILNEALITTMHLTQGQVEDGIAIAKKELEARTLLFRGDRPLPNVKDRFVILVDDGLASGFTMIAAATFMKRHGAERIVAAVPTSPLHSITRVASHVDELVCLNIREGSSFAVADAYVEWHDLTEMEVKSYLDRVSM